MDIKNLLQLTISSQASDLHLLVNSPPILRIDGTLTPVSNHPPLNNSSCQEYVFSLLSPQQKELFLNQKEIDFSYTVEQLGRFRINAYFEKGNPAASLRLIPPSIKTLKELNLPEIYKDFAKLRKGFILVTGPTGSGKSTTLAAIINRINSHRKEHIVTIEDPIEYLYQPNQSIISQREINHDSYSWKSALRSVLREDTDVVLVGEMRDYETIAAALTIAETGHLVFTTLHTNSAAQTIDRIVDVFPHNQQAQIKMQLSNTLEAILSQRLLPAIGGGRVPATEILLASSAVRSVIREGKTHQIDNIIQTSEELGMMSMEKSLAYWVRTGKITKQSALSWSLRPSQLKRLLGEK